MNLEYESCFTVYPEDTNNMFPMIFGGKFFSKLDKAAATAVRRLLYDSDTCDTAVTHKVLDLVFHKPCYLGDLIFINATITSLGRKSVCVEVKAHRELSVGKGTIKRELIASANFVFVTIASVTNVAGPLPYCDHGLTM